MLTRILTAVIALAIFVPILVFGGTLGASIVIAFFCGFSVVEMLMCCDLHKKWLISIPTVLIAVLTVMMPYIMYPYSFYLVAYMVAAIAVALVGFLFYGVLAHKKVDIERLISWQALRRWLLCV